MRKNNKRKKRKKLGLFRIVFFAMLIYVMVILVNQNKMMKEIEAKKLTLETEIGVLEEEIEELNIELESSDSLEFVEKVARDELGMVKPREIIVIDKDKVKNTFFSLFRGDDH